MPLRYRIIVNGRVQRVSFRAHTVTRALELGLTGRATNRSDGSVEVMAQGDSAALDALVKWLHKGPVFARVDSVVWDQVDLATTEQAGFVRN